MSTDEIESRHLGEGDTEADPDGRLDEDETPLEAYLALLRSDQG